MNLSQKCVAFLGFVVLFQCCLFAGSCFFLFREIEDAKLARVSSQVTQFAGECTGALHDATASLLLWGITRNRAAAERFDYCTAVLPRELAAANPSQYADLKTRELLKKLSSQMGMCLEDMKHIRDDSMTADVSLLKVSEIRQFFLNEVEPQRADIKETIRQLQELHLQRAKSTVLKDKIVRNSFLLSLEAAFGVNLMTMVLVVITFGQNITDRLRVITENVARFWRGDELNTPMTGVDEIATLDSSFHQMSKALSEAREKDQSILNNLPIALVVCAENGQIESMNDRASVLLPVSVDKDETKKLQDLITSPRITDLTELSSSTPRVWRITSPVGEVCAEMTLSAFRHQGNLKYLVGIMDVTAREEIASIKQEFIAVVSHDLRTPLTSMQLSAELIGMDDVSKLSPESTEAAARIQDECKRLLRLANGLLDMAKIESGNIRLEKQQWRLSEIIERALDAVEPAATAKGVELTCSPVTVSLVVDGDRLIQILVNLVANAVKFSEPGKSVSLSTMVSDGLVRILVRDQGPGIEKEKQKMIFEKFKQARSADASVGTGLGLAICKMLVDAHNGAIGVESEPGEGSTFWVELPVENSSVGHFVEVE